MARITVIPDDDWDGPLGELYPRVVDPAWGRVDHILAIHSLNPRSMAPHQGLYGVDGSGIPIGWAAEGANRNDIMLFDPTVDQIVRRGLHHDIDTIHLDRAYWGARVDDAASAAGITDLVRPPKRTPRPDRGAQPQPAPLGLRWTVERANSWLSNYGQLRRNTDRRPEHRLAQIALAVALIIVIKLSDHRNRWQPPQAPIR